MRAVIFDLVGTLAFIKENVDNKEVSSFLVSRGYEVYPQQWSVAWRFVAFIDYPKFGYNNHDSMLRRIFERLGVEIDEQTLNYLVKLYQRISFQPYPDALDAVLKAKDLGLKTAIATTVARFLFDKDLEQILGYIDFVCTGYEAGCEKSNPKMYKRILERLEVNPQEAVVIGDDIDIDIRLPNTLGIKTIMVDRIKKSKHVSEPNAIVFNLSDAMKIVSAWANQK